MTATGCQELVQTEDFRLRQTETCVGQRVGELKGDILIMPDPHWLTAIIDLIDSTISRIYILFISDTERKAQSQYRGVGILKNTRETEPSICTCNPGHMVILFPRLPMVITCDALCANMKVFQDLS